MTAFVIAVAAVVAVLAAVGALLANRRWMTLPPAQVLNRVIASLTVSTLVLMVAGCALFLRRGCPPDYPRCDGPTMGAMGISLIGAIVLAAIIVIGVPVAYLTIRAMRRR